MKFSLIIPVRNRRRQLIELLESLEQQSYTEPFETIVVDQSDIKEASIEISRGPCQWFYMEGTGASRSRNMAIKHASGDYLVCIDSDACLKEHALQRLDWITKDNPDYDVIFGIVTNMEDGLPYSNHTDFKPRQINAENCLFLCLGAAMVIKREALSGSGLFDENLGTGKRYGSCEEPDLVMRILESNGKALYHPLYEVCHPRMHSDSIPLRSWILKNYSYGMGTGALLRKYMPTKPMWAFKYLALFLLKPVITIPVNLLRFQGSQILARTASIVGKLHGFIYYRP